MQKRFKIFIVFICLLPFFMNISFATGPGELSDKIAFLKNGEVWVSDIGKQQPKQITSDSGKIDDFRFSPSLKYLAYSKIIGHEETSEEVDNSMQTFQEEVRSIQIMELASQKVIRTIMPTEDCHWIRISNWLSDNMLSYFSSLAGGADSYTYDIQKDLTKEDNNISSTGESESSTDGSLKIYRGYQAPDLRNIHLVNLRTKTDKIIFSKKSWMTSYSMSFDNKLVAIAEHEKIEKKNYYNLWVYDIKQGILKQLYRKGDWVSGKISWSFDNQIIGIFSPSGALAIEVDNPNKLCQIEGTDFSWVGNKEIVYHHGRDNNLHGVYLYSVASGKSDLLFDGAEKPVFLREQNK
ncbi:MAG: hypothetical protein ABSD46_03440 [Bacteroidota bacterium]